jgi:hypothetical protein
MLIHLQYQLIGHVYLNNMQGGGKRERERGEGEIVLERGGSTEREDINPFASNLNANRRLPSSYFSF